MSVKLGQFVFLQIRLYIVIYVILSKLFCQVVVCQNVARNKGMVQGVLTHEMIHMFDYCRNALDFKNVDHLACTEVRAANLTHCSFMSAWQQGDASPFRIQQRHQVWCHSKCLLLFTTSSQCTHFLLCKIWASHCNVAEDLYLFLFGNSIWYN